MRLSCSQKDLANALAITSKAVNTNNTLPVLNNVLLKAEGKKLYFTTTNLEVAISYWIETEVKNEGELTVPSRLFTNYINLLGKKDKVDITAEEDSVLIKTDDSKTKIKGIPASEFPPIPPIEKEGGFSVEVKKLKEVIHQVVFAAALNTTRPVLSGVYFRLLKDELKIAATDSYRLSEKTIQVTDAAGDLKCIIPAKTMNELGVILDTVDEKEKVEITISKNQILFTIGAIRLTSRLVEGQFPNYEQIIPKSTKTEVSFNSSDYSLVLKRINIFAKENNNKIVLKTEGGKLKITTETTQYGEGEIFLETKITGEENEIALNSQFLLDVLMNMGDKEGVMKIGEKINPVIIQPKDKEDYVHIIMPLKI